MSCRVLVITPLPPTKGPEADYGFHLVRRLAKRHLDVHVLTADDSVEIGEGVTLHRLMRGWSWGEGRHLVEVLRTLRPDAVLLLYIGWIYNEHPMITFTPTVVRRLSPNARVVTQFGSAYGSFASWAARPMRTAMALWTGRSGTDYNYGTLLRDSDVLIALCDRHRRILVGRRPDAEHKCLLIPPPPLITMSPASISTRQEERERLGLMPEEQVLAYFGYLYPGKGLETLLRSFAELVARALPVRLLIIGGTLCSHFVDGRPYASMIEQLARDLGIWDRTQWSGGYPLGSDLPSRLLRAADVCVLPFDLGVQLNNSSLIGAIAHHLPIVTTMGDMTEPCLTEGQLLLCAPHDAAALTLVLERVVRDRSLRERLAAGTRALAETRFSPDRIVDQVIDALGLPAPEVDPSSPC
jgi:glycosyltransferase involved in cell wall biosynthesis